MVGDLRGKKIRTKYFAMTLWSKAWVNDYTDMQHKLQKGH